MSSARRAFSVAVYVRRNVVSDVVSDVVSGGGAAGEVLVIMHRRLRTWLPIGGELEAGETPLEAAQRELREETGLTAAFLPLLGAAEGVPPGYLGYEEHVAGSKGLHMNFVFVADVAADARVSPNDEFDEYRWIDATAMQSLESPTNVREFGLMALDARAVSAES